MNPFQKANTPLEDNADTDLTNLSELASVDHQLINDHVILAERKEKVRVWRENHTAYPNDFNRTDRIETIIQNYSQDDQPTLVAKNQFATVAGRIMLKRVMGKASFITLQDEDNQLQLFVTPNEIPEAIYEEFKKWDLGDIIGAAGIIFRTNKGELSLRCSTIRLLSKALRPLPDKFHGLNDQEACYRQRYLDLIVNSQTRKTFKLRSQIIDAVRESMRAAHFLEVETPMLHPIPGGAAAKPFITHHHALDAEMYLRIAPELYLKRLIVAGFDRVFEINRNFRNEGISTRHNPEFTMMEFYAAYTQYKWLMNFTEKLLQTVATQVLGGNKWQYGDKELDFSQPFARLTIVEAIQKYAPHYDMQLINHRAYLIKCLKEISEIKYDSNQPIVNAAGIGALQLMLFEEVVETQLWQPTFIIDYPVEVSPLARASQNDSSITERFELFIAGREIANGFSELNDPEDQALRFKSQVDKKEAGDDEAMYYDADYIKALEYGMPPTGGCGIGIDRLVMLLSNSPSIRDVVLFPHLRKLENE